jgi:hypothetical protein
MGCHTLFAESARRVAADDPFLGWSLCVELCSELSTTWRPCFSCALLTNLSLKGTEWKLLSSYNNKTQAAE